MHAVYIGAGAVGDSKLRAVGKNESIPPDFPLSAVMKSLPRLLRHSTRTIYAGAVAMADPRLQPPSDSDCLYVALNPGPPILAWDTDGNLAY